MVRPERDPASFLIAACLTGAMALACTGAEEPEPEPEDEHLEERGPRAPDDAIEADAAAAGVATWSFGALGQAIGRSGIAAAQEGAAMEVYVGGSVVDTFQGNNVWSALRYSAAIGGFEQVYLSDRLSPDIVRVGLARAGSRADIIVALGDGTVRRYDQRTKRLRSIEKGPCAERRAVYALVTADLNGDGFDEIISQCDDGMLFAHGTHYQRWHLDASAAGTFDLTVGQMDGDPALEIATANGHVVDAETHAVEWFLQNQSGGFGRFVRAGDIDGDGLDEIVGADFSDTVRAYDVDLEREKWSFTISEGVDAIEVGDIDDDGVEEVVIGDAGFGDVHAFDGRTGQAKGVMSADFGVTDIAVVDVNLDGRAEVLWGAGATTTGSDHLHVADWPAGRIISQTTHLDGPFVGPQVGDLDGDGLEELVAVSFESSSSYESGRIVVVDGQDLTTRGISPPVSGGFSAATGVHDVVLRDLDGDGRPEIVIATDDFHDGLIEAYSFSAANEFSLVWENRAQPTGEFTSVEVADIDGDALVEVLAGGSLEKDSPGVYLYAYDASTGTQKWRRQMQDATSPIIDLVVADTDGDGTVEVAALAEAGNVYILDGVATEVEAVIPAQGTTLTSRVTSAGVELLLGDASGRMSVRQFDGATYVEIGDALVAPAAVHGLTVLDDGSLWVGSEDLLRGFDRALGGVETFVSRRYGPGMGRHVAVVPGQSLVFTTGAYGIHGFPRALPR